MRTIGIIAEYNPFHNGHLYQIEYERNKYKADNIVVVMSGDFVQRGLPAFTDKYLRTRMALKAGADLVFEMPVIYSCASAEFFALAGISMLNNMGFVDDVCFGSECDNIPLLSNIADILLSNNEDFENKISNYTKQGFSYPKAREKALAESLNDISGEVLDEIASPNNILGIEYIKAIKRINSNIRPLTIKRTDFGYHSHNISFQNGLASASAIRNAIKTETCISDETASVMPSYVSDILKNNPSRINHSSDTILSEILYYKLRLLSAGSSRKEAVISLKNYLDISEALADRIINNIENISDFDSFISLLKTKQYTYTRISRALTHIILDIHKNDMPDSGNTPVSHVIVPYLRLLGMNKAKSSLIRKITSVPVITKVADYQKIFYKYSKNEDFTFDYDKAVKIFEKDIFAADFYKNLILSKDNTCPDEYRAGIILS